MLDQVTPLARHWEALLRAEGLPAEPRSLYRLHPGQSGDKRGTFIPIDGRPNLKTRGRMGGYVVKDSVMREVAGASLGDAPVARKWALFSQAAYDLPDSWGRRKAFLVALGEHGAVSAACRETKTHPYKALVWQRQFAAWRLVNGC